jgi:hypothetical protein
VILLPLLACQDYGLSSNAKTPGADTAADARDDTAVGILPFPCEEEGTLVLDVAVDENCITEVKTGTLDTVVEWSISKFADYPDFSQVVSVPVVGNLTDDNGDGLINADDIPDIALIGDDNIGPYTHGALHIISGDGTEPLKAIYGVQYQDYQVYPYRYASVALGDLDHDGIPELVTIAELIGGEVPTDSEGGGDSVKDSPSEDSPPESSPHSGGDPPIRPHQIPPPNEHAPEGDQVPCRPVAFQPDGTVKWIALEAEISCAGHVPAIADLEGDGLAEVIIGPILINGEDGSLQGMGAEGRGAYPAFNQVGYISFAADLDNDFIQEVIAGATLYDSTATPICSLPTDSVDGFPAVADLDLDDDGEVVIVGNGIMEVFDHSCGLLASWELEGIGNGGPPTIADFDGDGSPEIGVATDTVYSVYEVDGTLLWSQPVTDASSHTTGSSVFDFDGDGQSEVIYADETTLWVYDGATGAVRLQDSSHTSRTLHEYPTIVDVDHDGMAEIVVPQGGGHHGTEFTGLYVLGSANQDWQYARPVWNQHAWSITNINDDLTVPAPAMPNWPDHNNFRSGDFNEVSGGATPDATVMAVVCDESCPDGTIGVIVRVGNGGMVDMRRDIAVSVYSIIQDEYYLLETLRTARSVNPGATSEAIGFNLNPLDIPEGNLLIRVDDNNGIGELTECHEDNNELILADVVCK